MLKYLLLLALLSSFMTIANAQIAPALPATLLPPKVLPEPVVIRLWPAAAPGALGTDFEKDVPTITAYLPAPDKATGAAIVVCPGGGYSSLSPSEGVDYALWLRERGITAFVLKYRLGSAGYRHPVMLNDVSRAMRLVRSSADEWKIDPKKIGVIGSSAGGHLASTVMTHFDAGQKDATDPIDRVSSRPDLGILCYPVITMGPLTNGGSKHNLIGTDASSELVQLLSNELHVTKDTPPTFIWHTQDDSVVPVENALDFVAALQKNKVAYDLHIYQKGEHGQGLGIYGYQPGVSDPKQLLAWTMELENWLRLQGYLK